MDSTDRLALPLLVPGQAQKELFHNEALMTADALIAAAIETGPRDDPPIGPAAGSCYIVGTAPTGEWSAAANQLACYGGPGWRFVPPIDGMVALNKSDGTVFTYWASAWHGGTVRASAVLVDGQQVIGPRMPAIADPAGGTSIDSEARTAIGQILNALRQHGLIGS